MIMKWKIDKKESGIPLGHYITRQVKETCSARSVKRMIEKGSARLNGKLEYFSSVKLKPGDVIEFRPVHDTIKPAEFAPSNLLYEDDILLVINKTAGYSVESSRSDRTSIFIPLRQMIPHADTFILLHRLDKETSGVLALVKNPDREKYFTDQFRNHTARKIYHALVEGIPRRKESELVNYLGVIGKKFSVDKWGPMPPPFGKKAITRYRILNKYKQASFLELKPLTGRTHQIRAQLAIIGHPIIGDTLYGNPYSLILPACRQMLHASQLTICHPSKGQISFAAPLPDDFLEKQSKLAFCFRSGRKIETR